MPTELHHALTPNFFLHNRPRAPRQVHELCEVIRRRSPSRTGPCSLHAAEVLPVELNNSIPARMFASGVSRHVILDISAQPRKLLRHTTVLVLEDCLKALGRQVRSSVQHDHELHHAPAPSPTKASASRRTIH